MPEKDVVITYETLYELLRIEKQREDLQQLNPGFFNDVVTYLNEKRKNFESKPTQDLLFVDGERERNRLELENIKKIVKDLYDKREKKIISHALNKSRSGVAVVNTANMMPCEKLLFNSVNMTLNEFRKNILFKVASGTVPDLGMEDAMMDQIPEACSPFSDSPPSVPEALSLQNGEEEDSAGLEFKRLEEPKELKITPNPTNINTAIKKVRFLTPIEEIVGPDLQIYGPYDKGATTSLPNELARVLLERNQAEEA